MQITTKIVSVAYRVFAITEGDTMKRLLLLLAFCACCEFRGWAPRFAVQAVPAPKVEPLLTGWIRYVPQYGSVNDEPETWHCSRADQRNQWVMGVTFLRGKWEAHSIHWRVDEKGRVTKFQTSFSERQYLDKEDAMREAQRLYRDLLEIK